MTFVPVLGYTHRHRLNRGGDRQATPARWRVAIVRMGTDQRARDYVARRINEGKSNRLYSAMISGRVSR